jgi:hypothetical protein
MYLPWLTEKTAVSEIELQLTAEETAGANLVHSKVGKSICFLSVLMIAIVFLFYFI